ncbi:MAG: hypothetical protein M3Y33_08905, partial [Actinomycetota bacterium]|nr:hypothetical protein [Actinomycetota bacterium]
MGARSANVACADPAWLALAAIVLVLAILVPPFGTYARRYAFAEALQFVVFAVAAPAALVLGVPWRFPRPRGGPGEKLRRSRVLLRIAADAEYAAVVSCLSAVDAGRPVSWRFMVLRMLTAGGP